MVDSSKSFLKKFKENENELCLEVMNSSYFSEIFRETVVKIMKEKNPYYLSACEHKNNYYKNIKEVFIGKDDYDKIYLLILGADNKTRLLIKDNVTYSKMFYGNIPSIKVSEYEFSSVADNLEYEKLKGVPKRFIKDEIEPFNAIKEFGIDNVLEYMKYLKDVANDSDDIKQRILTK